MNKRFADFPEAFDYCRECDKPVVVRVGRELWKLYPSGRACILSAVQDYDNDPRLVDEFARPDWNGDPNEY